MEVASASAPESTKRLVKGGKSTKKRIKGEIYCKVLVECCVTRIMFSHCFDVTPEWELAFSTECAALKNIVYLEKKKN